MADEKKELTSDELTLKEVFLVFDKHSTGTVAAEHLGMALRSCGKRLTVSSHHAPHSQLSCSFSATPHPCWFEFGFLATSEYFLFFANRKQTWLI